MRLVHSAWSAARHADRQHRHRRHGDGDGRARQFLGAVEIAAAEDQPGCRRHRDRRCRTRCRFHATRSEEHTSELQSLMRISYAVFCLKNNKIMKEFARDLMNTSPKHKEILGNTAIVAL